MKSQGPSNIKNETGYDHKAAFQLLPLSKWVRRVGAATVTVLK